MRAEAVEVELSVGRILSGAVFRNSGRKLLSKGHIVCEEDVRILVDEGLRKVWVAEVESGEVPEDEVVALVSREMGCGSLQMRTASGGRASIFATEPCCVVIDDDLLRQINCAASVVVATAPHFSYAAPDQRIAFIKSAPFAVPKEQLDAVAGLLKERGPILQARPIRRPEVAVLYTDPSDPNRAVSTFEPIVKQRLARFGVEKWHSTCAVEKDEPIAKKVEELARRGSSAIFVASTTNPSGPEDEIGRSMVRAGCHIERFLAPVDPGSLLLLGYRQDTPIVSAPGCHRSAKLNVLDLILPPILARYRISGWEIAALGTGGLLAQA